MRRDQGTVFTAIWLIGIGVLALTGWWWPGVMFVIGASFIAAGSLQGALWMFGIGILGWTNFWWPGILFVVGASILLGALRPEWGEKAVPAGDIPVRPPAPEPRPVGETAAAPPVAPQPETLAAPEPILPPDRNWLPSRCPACGAPLTPETALWHTDERAACPYCDSILEPPRT